MKCQMVAVALLVATTAAFNGVGGGMQGMVDIQAMQTFSSMYATSLLELQASWMWMQAADSMEKLAVASNAGAPALSNPAMGLEEGASAIEKDIDQSFLEVGEEDDGDLGMMLEHDVEKSLLSLVKLMYVQASHRLGASQDMHYQNKVIVSAIAGAGASSAEAGTIVQLLYYRDMLELITTTVTIQKQDIWNFWIFNEMIETDMFDGSEMPDEFAMRMAVSRLQAMSQFQTQAGLELASMVMDYYIEQTTQAIAGQFAGAGAQPQFANAAGAYAQGTSFLETGTQTGTGTQFVPSMALGGMFGWPQFLPYIKFYTAWIKYYVSSEMAMMSQVDAMVLMGRDAPMAEHKPQIMAHQTMPLLKQWTQLRLMIALFDFYSTTGAMGQPNQVQMQMQQAQMAQMQQAQAGTAQSDMWQQMPPQQMMPPQMPMGNPMADMMAGAQYLMADEPVTTTTEAPAAPVPDDENLISPPVPKLSSTQPAQAEKVPDAEPNLLG